MSTSHSATASARVQRWALTLSVYQYSIVHRPGSKQGNADALSRLPLPTILKEVPQPADTIPLIERLNASLVTTAQIHSWINRDPTLAKFTSQCCRAGQTKLYFQRRDELSIEDGCILWGARVVVLPQLRAKVVEEIHEGHPGIGQMKSFAKSYVWWP